MPLNISCSYHSSLQYEEGTHNFVLNLAIYYQVQAEKKTSIQNLEKGVDHCQRLMLDQLSTNKDQEAPTSSTLK